MKDENDLNRFDYVAAHIVYLPLFMLPVYSLLFKPIDGLNKSQSFAIMSVIFFVIGVAGLAVTYKKRRTFLSLYSTVGLAGGCYLLIAYRDFLGGWGIAAVVVPAVLCVAYTVLTMTRPIKAGSNKKTVLRRRTVRSLLGSKTIMGMSMLLLAVTMSVVSIFGGLTGAEITPRDEEFTHEQMSTLSTLRTNEWTELSDEQRLEILQTVADIEAAHLGLSHRLTVEIASLQYDILGSYSNPSQTVHINSYHINRNWGDVVRTVCHEAYHAYQYALCDLYGELDPAYRKLPIFDDIPGYINDFANYIDDEDASWEYMSQGCEEDAYMYAWDRVDAYLGAVAGDTSFADPELQD